MESETTEKAVLTREMVAEVDRDVFDRCERLEGELKVERGRSLSAESRVRELELELERVKAALSGAEGSLARMRSERRKGRR